MVKDDEEPDRQVMLLDEFLNNNHRLFTVIGVFAGLSVYLSQLGPEGSASTRIGVSASLTLFLISLIAISVKVQRAMSNARDNHTSRSYLRTFAYCMMLYCLIFLGFAISNIMYSKYSQSSGGLWGSSIIYSLLFVYWGIVSSIDFTEIEDGNELLQRYHTGIPYIAIAFVLLWVYYRWSIGRVELLSASMSTSVGYVFAAVVLHAFAVVAAVLVLLIGDRTVNRYRDWRG